jgi:hypothetical protein
MPSQMNIYEILVFERKKEKCGFHVSKQRFK